MKMHTRVVLAILFLMFLTTCVLAGEAYVTVYRAVDGAIVKHNGQRFCNRPLYCPDSVAFVMAGDRPLVRLVKDPFFDGTLMVAVTRNGKGKWLEQWSDVTSHYRADQMTWIAGDAGFPGLSVSLQVVPLAAGIGLGARIEVSGVRPGDQLVWAYGAVMQPPAQEGLLANLLDPVVGPKGKAGEVVVRGFLSDDCKGNVVAIDQKRFAIQPTRESKPAVEGVCSVSGLKAADAVDWQDFPVLVAGAAKDLPIVVGAVSLETTSEVFLAVETVDGKRSGDATRIQDAKAAFVAGLDRAAGLANRVTVDTPDPEFNAAVSAAAAAIDGIYRGGVFTHGAMAWATNYPGWRSMCGATAYGWHDRVQTDAGIYIGSQVTESDKRVAKSDPRLGYSQEAADSRFYGRGRIAKDQAFYNMQSQFFDQVVRDWRATGDAEFEKVLRPALELHLEWARDCFDPDDDGVYESYINTWPTDSQWYNGGGTAEETAYVYYGHRAALDMARRAGDAKAAERHEVQLDKIKNGFLKSLWISRLGYAGAYREQGGYRRLHEDAWLYSIFLPIDAGLLNDSQMVQALQYTEWGLERQKMPFGGEQVWTSNWVPSTWSVRELWPADCWSVSLAYCQAGLPDDAWKVFEGTYLDCMYDRQVPGGVAQTQGGTDFAELSNMFCRAVVEGMFGYAPDYPNGVVRIAPQLPSHWDHARITTPDVCLEYRSGETETSLHVRLQREAAMMATLPVRAKKVVEVTVNGQRLSEWKLTAGFGQSVLNVEVPRGREATVVVKQEGALPLGDVVELVGNVGDPIVLSIPDGRIVGFDDPQKTLTDARIEDGAILGRLAENPGHHLVIGLADVSGSPQRRLFKIRVTDRESEAVEEGRLVMQLPKDAKYACIDMREALNGDIRTIFKQQYLSPRPQTCSARIGVDAYSPWTFYYWDAKAPEIDLSNVPQLLVADKLFGSALPMNRSATDTPAEGASAASESIMTPQGVPFAWPGTDRNIAFTSLWDNWPKQVTVPVKRRGEAICLLVCGSTNPMQCRIANAELRMKYADGVVETLELVPPLNYWNVCPLRISDDYNYERDVFCLPKTPPATVQLGKNCRAMLLNRRLRPNVELESVTLETLSQEVVVGLMGVTIMNPAVQ